MIFFIWERAWLVSGRYLTLYLTASLSILYIQKKRHLGDSNVPSSLVFIDKYAQVPLILMPICTVLRRLPQLAEEDEAIDTYIKETFGGVESAKRLILQDFFKHAFDGSGGTNSFDSGSCIDGRLTSTFEWSQRIESKKYFPLFLLAGFTGFQGSDFS